ncbi:MAG: NADPH-dependent F420 reductase [Myxococcota bacterium]
MRIAIIGGTGKEGKGLALRWARAGHSVVIGSRDAGRAQQRALELSQEYRVVLQGSSNDAILPAAEVVVLAVPYTAHRETLSRFGESLAGKILIDITVPLVPPTIGEVRLPPGTSAALEGRALAPKARYVATLHHVSSAHLSAVERDIGGDVLLCSDDEEAKDVVLPLLEDLGVRAFDAGPLCNAIALESLTPVLIYLNERYQCGGTGVRITGLPSGNAA